MLFLQKLHEWYGGGPVISRPMVETGFVKKRLVVEVYPMAVRALERRHAKKQVPHSSLLLLSSHLSPL
jgi:hypothetical protein